MSWLSTLNFITQYSPNKFTLDIRNILTRSAHDNILLMEGFNPKLNVLLIEDHGRCNLISGPTYFKSINPICIGNFLID